MHEELLRQWRSLIGAWMPASAWTPAAPSFTAAADAFGAALQAACERGASGREDDKMQAAGRFADFLRAQFGEPSAFAAVGPLREHQQRAERMGKAQLRMEEARQRLTLLWSDALRETAQRFAGRCLDPAVAQRSPASLYDEWIECAEQAYAGMAHAAAFCDAQAEWLNASNELRRELQESLEFWSKSLDLPTRSEINALHRQVKLLRAQLAEAIGTQGTRSAVKRAAVKRSPRPAAAKAAPRPVAAGGARRRAK
jgi:class III poly(R)-hydroxyalkanoic acid synthase PhaE subunit